MVADWGGILRRILQKTSSSLLLDWNGTVPIPWLLCGVIKSCDESTLPLKVHSTCASKDEHGLMRRHPDIRGSLQAGPVMGSVMWSN